MCYDCLDEWLNTLYNERWNTWVQNDYHNKHDFYVPGKAPFAGIVIPNWARIGAIWPEEMACSSTMTAFMWNIKYLRTSLLKRQLMDKPVEIEHCEY